MEDVAPERKTPRILLTSGIFPPDVGGPATHVRHIAEHFASLGWQVTVVAFGEATVSKESYRVVRVSRRMPKLVSWLFYAFHIARESAQHDVVYGFDLTTAGLPSALFARFFDRPFLLRIGGDPIWERVVEKGERFLSMRAYYEQRLYRKDRPVLFRLIRYVVRSAERIVTYCDFLKTIYVDYYGVVPGNVHIVPNPFPVRRAAVLEHGTFTFVFAGRFVSYKNLPRVISVFLRVARTHPEARLLLIGDGPEEAEVRRLASERAGLIRIMPKVDQATLFTLIGGASVALAPALTEFNPNFILEALALGKPALISRDNGLSARLPDDWQFDPLDDASLEAAMVRMLDGSSYQEALDTVRMLPTGSTWDTVVERHAALVREELPPAS